MEPAEHNSRTGQTSAMIISTQHGAVMSLEAMEPMLIVIDLLPINTKEPPPHVYETTAVHLQRSRSPTVSILIPPLTNP